MRIGLSSYELGQSFISLIEVVDRNKLLLDQVRLPIIDWRA